MLASPSEVEMKHQHCDTSDLLGPPVQDPVSSWIWISDACWCDPMIQAVCAVQSHIQ